MRAAVRILVTLCVVALAVFAGYQLWQYYMLTPWTRDARFTAELKLVLEQTREPARVHDE